MPAGNVSIGKFIVPYPHVRQVLVPEEGCRVILGTDGLWDFLATAKIFSSTSRMAPAAAAQTLCKQAFAAQVCFLKSTFQASSHISDDDAYPHYVRPVIIHVSVANIQAESEVCLVIFGARQVHLQHSAAFDLRVNTQS